METSRPIESMEKEEKSGVMDHALMGILKMVLKQEKENLFGVILVIMKENLGMASFMGMEFMSGVMGKNMKECGMKIECMEKVNLHGPQVKYMLVSMKMIQSMDSVL
jgi:hypothetical protein